MYMSERVLKLFAAIGLVSLCIVLAYGIVHAVRFSEPIIRSSPVLMNNLREEAPVSPTVEDAWVYTFNVPGVLYEVSRPELSPSPYWWVSSGGMLIIENDLGHTIEQALPRSDTWAWRYRRNNPLDTDGGRYPQNLFRLISKRIAGDADVSALFEVRAVHTTDTPNRDMWSGVFLITRYQDSDNLYYAGVRQDGHAVIKKKIQGVYYTLGEIPLFSSANPYNKYTNPNLIPGNTWMGFRVRTEMQNGSMEIVFSIDEENDGTWQEVLSVIDSGTGGPPHSGEGHVGIRTDYLDVAFDDFTIIALK